MNSRRRPPRLLFRIWVVRYEQWRPGTWDELPPRAVAVEAAEAAPLSAPKPLASSKVLMARCSPAAADSGQSPCQ